MPTVVPPPVTLGIGTSHWNGCRSMQLPQGCNILENIRWGFITLEGIFYSWWKFLPRKSKQSLAKHIIPSWITVSIPKAPAQQKPYSTINKYKQIEFAQHTRTCLLACNTNTNTHTHISQIELDREWHLFLQIQKQSIDKYRLIPPKQQTHSPSLTNRVWSTPHPFAPDLVIRRHHPLPASSIIYLHTQNSKHL